MGALVPMSVVYTSLYKMYSEIIDDFANRHAKPTISFEAFSSALLASECVADVRTIRLKWDTAVAQGVLDITGISRNYTSASLDAEALRYRVKGSKACAHTHTQTSKKVRVGEF